MRLDRYRKVCIEEEEEEEIWRLEVGKSRMRMRMRIRFRFRFRIRFRFGTQRRTSDSDLLEEKAKESVFGRIFFPLIPAI
jgi:hypothetical protein